MHTLGHTFVPAGFHAGGLRYHGSAPLVSQLLHEGVIEAVAIDQLDAFESAVTFARSEGIVPAPESAHAIRGAVNEALAARDAGEERTILFGLSGHGNFDLAAYQNYLNGKLTRYEHPQAAIDEALRHLPEVAAD
jgi:tryptophan synthase beta chain